MKNTIIVLCISVLASFNGCSSDPTAPEDQNPPSPTILGTATIGSEGGTFSVEGFQLVVPQGAFNSATELTLYDNQNDNPGFENVVSGKFNLNGIPDSFNKPLTLKIKHTGIITDTAYIALGEKVFVKSLKEEKVCYRLLSVTDSSGYLSGTLSVPSETTLMKGESGSDAFDNNLSVNLLCISGYYNYLSVQGHFLIKFPVTVLTEAQNLAGYLETAYSKFKDDLNFSYSRRTKWPVEVTVRVLKNTVFGYTINSVWGNNYGYMEFNFNKMNESINMKLTAGHEFFHLVQSLYDHRNRYSKAKSKPPEYWLDEACSVWSEEFFSSKPNFVSEIFDQNATMVLQGAKNSLSNDNNTVQAYGYGMAALIKYLTNRFGNDKVVKFYDEIYNGSNPFLAINKSIPDDVGLLWHDFMQKYLTYSVYEGEFFKPGWLIANAKDNKRKFLINSESDTLKSYAVTLPDLSAMTFSVENRFDSLDGDAKLMFDTGGNTTEKILLFKEKPSSECVFLDQGYTSLTIDKFKSITEAGYQIVAVVIDDNDISPYDGQTPVNFNIKVISKAQSYSYMDFDVSYGEILNIIQGTDSMTQFYNGGWVRNQFNQTISIQGNKIISDGERIDNNNNNHDNLTITVDNVVNPTIITNLDYSANLNYNNGAGGTKTVEYSFSGKDIPLNNQGETYKAFVVEGDITNNITEVHYTEVSDNLTPGVHIEYHLVSIDASNGHVYITLYINQE